MSPSSSSSPFSPYTPSRKVELEVNILRGESAIREWDRVEVPDAPREREEVALSEVEAASEPTEKPEAKTSSGAGSASGTAIAVLLAVLLGAISVAPTHAQIYVDADASGANDGTSWFDAHTSLQDALEAATGSDEIWIAEGVYTPGADTSDSFVITGEQDGLKMYGGFDDGDAFADRNPSDHLVILSGDIDDDDNTGADGVTRKASDINGDNSNTVVLFDGGSGDVGADVGPNITDATVLDGVTISGGYASGAGEESGSGGGLYCDGTGDGNACSPALTNLVFAGNRGVLGGGMFNDGGSGGTSSPTMTDITFAYNLAAQGGALYNWGSPGQSSPTIRNGTFAHNTAGIRAGAIENFGVGGASSPTITNATFADNSANKGGAIANLGGDFADGPSGASAPTITNSILYGDDASVSGEEIYNAAATPTLRHTLIEGGLAGIEEVDGSSTTDAGGNVDAAPLYGNPSDPAGPDGIFATGDDGLRLLTGSPALDAGDDSAITLTEDITGATRTQNGTVDLGAYEGAIAAPSGTIYVDASAGGADDGSSWADAYTSLRDALSAATGSSVIWIAEGLYTPTDDADISDTNQDASFTVTGAKDGLTIYGGFESGDDFGNRNPADHPVVLSGDIDNNDDTTADGVTKTVEGINGANAYNVLVFDGGDGLGSNVGANITEETVLDGVTVTGGKTDGDSPFSNSSGSGLYCDGQGGGNECSPTLANLIFAGNRALVGGGAVYNNGGSGTSSPTITGSVFTGNSVSGNLKGGGAIHNNGAGGTSSPTIERSVFKGNRSASGKGGAIYNEGTSFSAGQSNPTITNSTFAGNSAENGGAIYNDGSDGTSELTVVNVTFNGNSASTQGGAIYNDAEPALGDFGTSNSTIQNSILYGNNAANGGNEVYNDGGDAFASVSHSLIQGGLSSIPGSTVSGGGNVDADPRFLNTGLPAGVDGTFATSDDGLRLRAGSPAVDAASNTFQSGTKDVTGATRTQNGTVDMGAYEGTPPDPAEIIYVDASAPGAEDGTSWGDAYTRLQNAFGDATENDELWIAEGTYSPGPDAGDRFSLTGVHDGLKIYGGFESGDAFADRNPADHPVILDGTDTNNHVLFFDGTSGGKITDATVLEGVTVTGGVGNGGGLFCDGEGDGNACSPTLTNVVFAGNSTSGDGGALYLDGSDGGAASPAITNALFTGNTAGSDGGAITNNGRSGGEASPALTNVTIAGNEATERGGALFNDDDGGTARPVLTNAIVWGNATGSGGPIHNDAGSPTFSHSLVEGRDLTGTGTGNLDGINPASDRQFVDATDPDGGDDTFATSDDGLRLFEESPAIDAGDDSAISITNDLAGAARTQNATVDMGAYEGGVDRVFTFHVDGATGSDASDGKSWGQAFATLTKALSVATDNDEIWIAEGTYTPGSNRGDSFTITGPQDGLKIYGGFENGDAFADRTPGAHPVILSGDIGVSGDSTDNSYRVLVFDGGDNIGADVGPNVTGATVLDGVTVTGGHAAGENAANRLGGGLYCDGRDHGNECSPAIRNVVFSGNSALAIGGAMYNDGAQGGTSSPTITDVVFENNTATDENEASINRAGGMYNQGHGGESSPTMTNVVFVDNSADTEGGAIYNVGDSGISSPTMTNVTFVGNSAETGGAIYNDGESGTSTPTITNSIFYQNGDEIFNQEATPTLSHSLVEGLNPGGTNLPGDADPLFADPTDADGPDDRFATSDDGLRLQAGSPVLDAGDGGSISVTEDVIGAARTQGETVDLGAYEGATSVALLLSGTAGADGTDAGWRFIGVPTASAEEAGDLRIGGTAPRFALPSGHMLQAWDDAQGAGSPTGGYDPIESGTETLEPGRGYALYVFDEGPFPIDPSTTIDVAGNPALRSGTTVTVSSLAQSARWHLLANPYPTGYDLSSLTDLADNGFQASIQRFDGVAGTWDVTTQGTVDLSAWQGFFVERSDPGGADPGATSLTFDPAGRTSSAPFIKSVPDNRSTDRRAALGLALRVVGADGDTLSRDRAAQVVFDDRAGEGWDAWDASKLESLGAEYALVAPEGTGRNGEAVRKAVESRPWPDERQEIRLRLINEGLPSLGPEVQATLSIDRWGLPEGWRVRIVDRQSGETTRLGPEATLDVRLPSDSTRKTPRYELQVAPAGAPLPVELAAFEATETGDGTVRLRWQTASETNNAGFEVLRKGERANRGEGAWEQVGFAEGMGTAQELQSYRFTDADLPYAADTLTYRLRQVDTDGATHLFDPIALARSAVQAVQLRGSFPNPARAQATIRYALPEARRVRLDVYDVLGRRVQTLVDERQTAGRKEVRLRAAQWSSGTYLYRLTAGTTTQTGKLTIVR